MRRAFAPPRLFLGNLGPRWGERQPPVGCALCAAARGGAAAAPRRAAPAPAALLSRRARVQLRLAVAVPLRLAVGRTLGAALSAVAALGGRSGGVFFAIIRVLRGSENTHVESSRGAAEGERRVPGTRLLGPRLANRAFAHARALGRGCAPSAPPRHSKWQGGPASWWRSPAKVRPRVRQARVICSRFPRLHRNLHANVAVGGRFRRRQLVRSDRGHGVTARKRSARANADPRARTRTSARPAATGTGTTCPSSGLQTPPSLGAPRPTDFSQNKIRSRYTPHLRELADLLGDLLFVGVALGGHRPRRCPLAEIREYKQPRGAAAAQLLGQLVGLSQQPIRLFGAARARAARQQRALARKDKLAPGPLVLRQPFEAHLFQGRHQVNVYRCLPWPLMRRANSGAGALPPPSFARTRRWPPSPRWPRSPPRRHRLTAPRAAPLVQQSPVR